MKSDALYLASGDVFGILDVNQMLVGSVRIVPINSLAEV